MATKLDLLSEEMKQLTASKMKSGDEAQKEILELKLEIQALNTENKKLNELNIKLVEESSQQLRDRQLNGKTLQIGSSILRSLDEARLESADVVCLRGTKIRDIHNELKAGTQNATKVYDRIILLGGGNDCSDKDRGTADNVAEYQNLLETAKGQAKQVSISSLPPRLESGVNDRITQLNAALSVLAEEEGVDFINHHESFHLLNNRVNDGYFEDGVHLTLKGSHELAISMGLKCIEELDLCTSKNPQQTSPVTWRTKPLPTTKGTKAKPPTRTLNNPSKTTTREVPRAKQDFTSRHTGVTRTIEGMAFLLVQLSVKKLLDLPFLLPVLLRISHIVMLRSPRSMARQTMGAGIWCRENPLAEQMMSHRSCRMKMTPVASEMNVTIGKIPVVMVRRYNVTGAMGGVTNLSIMAASRF